MSATTTIKRRSKGLGVGKKAKTKGEAKQSQPSEAKQAKARSSAIASLEVSNGYFLLLTLVGLLCAFGVMMVLSASSVDALRSYGSSWFFFRRQLVWMGLGAVMLWFMQRTDYRFWRKWSRAMVYGAVALMLLVLVPGIGQVVGGSRRWLGAGPLSMQPSELAKFALLFFASDLLSRRGHLMKNWRQTSRPVCLVFGVMAFLIMLQPDMGTTLILTTIVGTMLFVGGTPLRQMARVGGVAFGSAALLAIVEPYRRERLLSFRDPFQDAANTGYQMVQSLVGIGSGGLTGVGLGASRAKWGFLPNAHTDFIFAIIAEELGLVGATLVVLLFAGFAVLGVRTASRAPDRFGMLVAAGITSWVTMQAFLNIAAVIGLVPVTGVPLPFLSQGGSSLVVLMAATGVLLNIAYQGERKASRAAAAESAT